MSRSVGTCVLPEIREWIECCDVAHLIGAFCGAAILLINILAMPIESIMAKACAARERTRNDSGRNLPDLAILEADVIGDAGGDRGCTRRRRRRALRDLIVRGAAVRRQGFVRQRRCDARGTDSPADEITMDAR